MLPGGTHEYSVGHDEKQSCPFLETKIFSLALRVSPHVQCVNVYTSPRFPRACFNIRTGGIFTHLKTHKLLVDFMDIDLEFNCMLWICMGTVCTETHVRNIEGLLGISIRSI